MYLLPLMLSNLHLGLDAPVGSLNLNLGKPSFVRSKDFTSRVPDRYYPTASFEREVLDFVRPWADLGADLLKAGLKVLNNRHQQQYHVPDHVIRDRNHTNIDDNVFKITLPMNRIHEINVEVVDRSLVVEAFEPTKDNGNVFTRQFVRKYMLPSRAQVDQIKATKDDGFLIVTVPLKPKDERVIKIE
ncbi:protein lethal(2)essential for life-like [Temnothorax curvispinosus]|uniref:Protein lethal(2)essential for life-like n=1 Tax=Temnothorax curvispinosus TaxID=300111 RepID=A0A6J1R9E3_9HYME|nr:protein lethal(2)essential for life-like [Temnothorax curvispinosus]